MNILNRHWALDGDDGDRLVGKLGGRLRIEGDVGGRSRQQVTQPADGEVEVGADVGGAFRFIEQLQGIPHQAQCIAELLLSPPRRS